MRTIPVTATDLIRPLADDAPPRFAPQAAPDVIFGAISLGAPTDHTYHCLGTFELSRRSQGDKRAGYRPGSHREADSADVTLRAPISNSSLISMS